MFELESHVLIANNPAERVAAEADSIIEHIHELGKLVNGLLNALNRAQIA